MYTYAIINFFLFLIQNVPMPKSKLLNIRIDPDLKKRAKRLAEEDNRSLSNWVTYLIAREVERAEAKKKDKGK